jgi:ATP-dependent HslUV protease subunit HslV
MSESNSRLWQGSTILSVRKGNEVVIAGDGQVTEGALILKSNVKKVRRLADGGVIVGFTGSMADALVLFETLENKVAQNPHQLIRSCVDLAKYWRKDPHLSQVNAMMVVVNSVHSLVITGSGDVLEKEDGIIGVGVGGPYAFAAAKALFGEEGLTAREIVEKSMNIAADICVFTNRNIAFERIEIKK